MGSIFAFTLALEEQAEPNPTVARITRSGDGLEGAAQRIFAAGSALHGLRVLVVDDHAATQEFLQSVLESFSFRVSRAWKAEDALFLLEQEEAEPFGLVLMDWNFPDGLDGFEAARRIKQNAKLAKIPIILLGSAEETLRKSNKEGLDGYLVKPTTRSQLLDAIMQILGHQDLTLARPASKTIPEETLDRLRGKHVLLVEDNEINQLVATELLEQMGMRVSLASRGEQAVQMTGLGSYNVLLMDINMPGMDGYQATAQIRKDPRFDAARLPIIAMTAYALDGDNQKALEAGMNDYISKPVDMAQLARVLRRWMDKPV
jgi:CheY-like chemotaxis protein